MAARKIVLVTGGNNGLGFEIVKALLQSPKPYHVFMASRSELKAKTAIESLEKECVGVKNTVESVTLDLTSDESINGVYETLKKKGEGLDVLIINAGIAIGALPSRNEPLREAFNRNYDTNVTGTHILTYTLAPLLLASNDPRLLFIAGLAGQTQATEKYFPTPPTEKGWPKRIDFETIAYRCSKTALNMLMLDWNHKLRPDNVKVWAVAPGMMLTDLGGMRSTAETWNLPHPSLAAAFVLSVVEGERDADVGRIVGMGGKISAP